MIDHLVAIRMHARTTGDFERARAVLEEASVVRWDAAGEPILPEVGSLGRGAAIALADILIARGQETKGRRLLATIIGRMREELHKPGQSELWYYPWHPIALALYGDREAAIGMLQRQIANNVEPARVLLQLTIEPAFAGLREDLRVQAMLRQLRSYVGEQRRELDRLRAEGLVPDRSKPASPAG